jgi:hypothetical protein
MFLGCQPCCDGCPVNYAPFLAAETLSATVFYSYSDEASGVIGLTPVYDYGLSVTFSGTYTLTRTSVTDTSAEWASATITANGRDMQLVCLVSTESGGSLEFRVVRGDHPTRLNADATGNGWIGFYEKPCDANWSAARALGLWKFSPGRWPYGPQPISTGTPFFAYAHNREAPAIFRGIRDVAILNQIPFVVGRTLEIENPLINYCEDFDPLINSPNVISKAAYGIIFDEPSGINETGIWFRSEFAQNINEGPSLAVWEMRENVTITTLDAVFADYTQNMRMNVSPVLWDNRSVTNDLLMRSTRQGQSDLVYLFVKQFPDGQLGGITTPCEQRQEDPYYDAAFFCDYYPEADGC